MKIKNRDLKKRILEISYKYKLSHLGSCLTAVDIIDEIYQIKKTNEKFILSSGHAGLALYVVIEKYLRLDAEKIFLHHGIHPDRCKDCFIDCSTGSLGQGLPIAVGMALSDKKKKVYCLISDGECTEGSISEALMVWKDQKLNNLHIYLNSNGWAAYGLAIKVNRFKMMGIKVINTNVEQLPFLKGQDAHYHVMTAEEYEIGVTILK